MFPSSELGGVKSRKIKIQLTKCKNLHLFKFLHFITSAQYNYDQKPMFDPRWHIDERQLISLVIHVGTWEAVMA